MAESTPIRGRLTFSLLLTVVLGGAAVARSQETTASESQRTATAEGLEFFEKKIRPVLVTHCYECHSAGAEQVEGELLLDSREGVRRGGATGTAVKPGEPTESLLLSAIRYEELEMPPDGKLSAEVIADFEKWIEIGAPDPRDGAVESRTTSIDMEAARQYWAFQPPRRQSLPDVQNASWPTSRIDWFVLQRQEQVGLSPAEPADRRTLLRRLSFDLLGLPPNAEQVQQFVDDTSPHYVEDAVDRLLASPRFGERWARRWLDVARYAEDQAHIVGDDKSLFFPNAYRYRDWVIGALNRDLRYDQFVRLQLAADLFEPADRTNLVALGYIGLGPKYYQRRSPAVMADEWEDRVDVVTRGLLGLTVACARCHDHKYDPIESEDYYALAGVFASSDMFNLPLDESCEKKKDGEAKSPSDALHVVRENEQPVNLNLLIRGDVNNKGAEVPRRFLRVLAEGEPVAFTQGSGRRELAEAIACRDNPLTARVLVNRVWQHLLGEPLVGTPSNFGKLGQPPSHPQLLDDLAVRFMDADWSIKWLVREVVLSATYQQSSETTEAKQRIDPSNRWLSHANRRRLDIEAWRDSLLSAGGNLDSTLGGPSVDVQDQQVRRRTLYAYVSRLELNRMLAMFDFPDPNAHSARRSRTTTPLQKLFLMNSPFIVRRADDLAQRLLEDPATGGDSDQQRIERAYRLLLARAPSSAELEAGLQYVQQDPDNQQQRWRQYAQVLLVSNEMLFID